MKVMNNTKAVLTLKSDKGETKSIAPGKSVKLKKEEIQAYKKSCATFLKMSWIKIQKAKATDSKSEEEVVTEPLAMDLGNDEIRDSEKKEKEQKAAEAKKKKTRKKAVSKKKTVRRKTK